ncbi:MAG: DUF3592 domain-containing protein [Thermoguttaceae bacterium]
MGRRNISLGCGVVLGLFALILSGTLLVLDGYLGLSVYRQIRAQNYPTTNGVITHSEVTGHGGRHSNYSPNVQYKYAVAGKTYSSTCCRFGDVYANEGIAHRIVAEHPLGKPVRVYYNPDNPADALLQPGVDGSDLFLATFLLPFNLVLLVIGSLLAGEVRRDSAKAPAGGAKMWDDGFQVRVRVSQTRPFVVAAVVAGLLAFGSLFVALGFGAPHPPMALMVAAWCVILVGWLLGYIVCRWRLAQGGSDLVIDTTAQQVTLPRIMGRKTEVTIPMRAITGIEVQKFERRGSRGETYYFYVPTFAFTDASGTPCHAKLVEWFDQACAEDLAAWLRERLRIAPPRGDVG